MEEEYSSWVRRAKFSHTVCHRLGSSGLPSLPPDMRSDHDQTSMLKSSKPLPSKLTSMPAAWVQSDHDAEVQKLNSSSSGSPSLPASSVSFQPDSQHEAKQKQSISKQSLKSFLRSEPDPILKPERLNPGLVSVFSLKAHTDPDSCKSSLFSNGDAGSSKPNQRSRSPLPATILSDAFKEARTDGKRFSSPPPSRKVSDVGSFGRLFSRSAQDHQVLTNPSPRETSPPRHFSLMKNSDKSKNWKETSWMRYFDHAGGRVTAVETTDEWMVDLSKLYLGLRFACGAHSRLYHGIYKDQHVAVKIIRQPDDDENGVMASRLEKQFIREVTFLSHLYHRNVIKLVGACKKPPVFCIITEYLSGGSLRAFLHKLDHQPLPLQKLVAIALDIAHGMEYIHSQGVIHRDLKPENIIFDEAFCVKIADFGIACEEVYCDAFAEDSGTYRWMAPEMIKHKHYGRKADVYSFGLVLWEMLTGTVPYEDMIPIQAAFAVVNKNLRPVIPAECPAAMRALIEQCWTSHADKRPEFCQIVQVLEQFEAALTRDGTLDMVPNLSYQHHKHWPRHSIQKPRHTDAGGTTPMPRFL